jgi:2-polyprenyl-6-methoxyphenol hydroxylase-like FAD-dependent oxidoreductase
MILPSRVAVGKCQLCVRGGARRRNFYLDEATQIRLQSWASGRIALVGDAAYCCSPIGGQGSSVALIGAYTLAGELKLARHDGRVDYRQGCHAYETHVRRYVLAFQALAFDSVTNNSMITPDRFNGIVNSITLEAYS